jgi:hypothetical protein
VGEHLIVRHAVLADAEGIARAHTRSWKIAYRGIMSVDYLDALCWETRCEIWSNRLSSIQPKSNNLLVATDADGNVKGFAAMGEVRDSFHQLVIETSKKSATSALFLKAK